MLCGIGGNTIEQAQQNMSYHEVQRWAAYRRQRGSLHTGMRVEHSIALLASMYANAHRKKNAPVVSIYEFTPHDQEPAISLDKAMETWH